MEQILSSLLNKVVEIHNKVLGDSVIRYGGNDKPILSCGARVVIETDADVEIIE